jgi:hypothetical protein
MLQIIRDILKHDDDETQMSLLFANQVSIDRNYTHRFIVKYARLSRITENYQTV